jgi:hypothetical protein
LSGLDYALARYFDSRTGTFCSAGRLAEFTVIQADSPWWAKGTRHFL